MGDAAPDPTTTRKRSVDVVVGDIIVFLGTPHRVHEIVAYTHPTVPGFFGIALARDGWGISLHEHGWTTVD